jgi:hypothetical protein
MIFHISSSFCPYPLSIRPLAIPLSSLSFIYPVRPFSPY